jgi:hypothetical protein
MSLFDYLRWIIRMGARFELSRPRLAQVAYRALISDRPFGDEPFVQIRRQVMDFYDNLVEMGIAQGTIDPYIDRGVAVFILSTLFNEFGRFLIERHNIRFENLASGETTYQELLVEELAGHLIRILERGFAPAPQKTGAVNHA